MSSLLAVSTLPATSLVLLAAVVVLVVGLAVQRRRAAVAAATGYKEAPMMKGWLPIVGHLPKLMKHAHRVMTETAKAMNTSVYQMRLGSNVYYVVTSQEGINETFYGPNASHFASRPMLQSALDMTRGVPKHLIFGPNNDFHVWARKFCVQRLLSTPALKSYMPFISEARDRLLRELHEACHDGQVAFDPMPFLIRGPMSVMFRILLGEDLPEVASGSSQNIADWLREGSELVLNNAGDFLPLLNTLHLNPKQPVLRQWLADMDKLLLPYIRQHEATLNVDSPRDFLDAMLIFRQSAECTPTERAYLDDTGLGSMVLGLFAAAADTLFCNLGFLMCFMAEHPAVQARVHAEIDAVVGTHRLVDTEDQDHLPYLRATLKESFRVKPSVPIIMREATEDTVLQGYHVPKGAGIYLNVFAMQNDERVFGADAKEFKPERFLDDLSTAVGSSKEQKWVPYGGGERLCVGYRLAQAENFLFSSGVLQCFEIIHPTPGVNMSDKERFGLSMCPEDYKIFMKPRQAYKEAQLDATMRA